MTEVAESLEIEASLLSKWVQSQRQDGEEAFRGNGKGTAVAEEIWRLKQRNKALEEELEFLKEVSRYFLFGGSSTKSRCVCSRIETYGATNLIRTSPWRCTDAAYEPARINASIA
jgi:hypothetical protein